MNTNNWPHSPLGFRLLGECPTQFDSKQTIHSDFCATNADHRRTAQFALSYHASAQE